MAAARTRLRVRNNARENVRARLHYTASTIPLKIARLGQSDLFRQFRWDIIELARPVQSSGIIP